MQIAFDAAEAINLNFTSLNSIKPRATGKSVFAILLATLRGCESAEEELCGESRIEPFGIYSRHNDEKTVQK